MAHSDSLTDVPGIAVGHAEVPGGGSGCTVVLGPFRARVDRRGPATGSRELEVLREEHPVERVDALLLTGGSAFGLAAAEGVVDFLEAAGRGYPTRVQPVPIVPAAVIYDLDPDRARPGSEEGRRACEGASAIPVPSGRFGVGAGARVSKLFGIARAVPSGIGSASLRSGPWTVGALVVTNAVGEILEDGRVAVGERAGMTEAEFLRLLLEGESGTGSLLRAGENTTLAVVATDAPLGGEELVRLARISSTALARRISPVHTPFDGDLTFALTTSEGVRPPQSRELLRLGIAARTALEAAILRSVGRGAG